MNISLDAIFVRHLPIKTLSFCALLIGSTFNAALADYSEHPKAEAVVSRLVEEFGFSTAQARSALKQAKTEQRILDSMANAAEKTKTWTQYRKSFLVDARITQGRKFLHKYKMPLQRAEEKYGVPPHIIVAILGIETNYGGYTGKATVLDALATLAFEHPRRGKFFGSELAEFIVLAKEKGWDLGSVQGSYAGAMGMSQFMPSNYRRLAVDGSGDGVVDLFDVEDAISSVAHYFVHHGWIPNEPVAFQLSAGEAFDSQLIDKNIKPNSTAGEIFSSGFTLKTDEALSLSPSAPARVVRFNDADGDEFWLALKNFYVISRYNPRTKYAMAVHLLSQELLAESL